MKRILFLFTGLLLFLAAATGCQQCICCGAYIGTMTCVKGTDTVTYSQYPTSLTFINLLDSITFYQNQGYTCSNYGLGPYTYGLSPTCGKDEINQAKAAGFGCISEEAGSCD